MPELTSVSARSPRRRVAQLDDALDGAGRRRGRCGRSRRRSCCGAREREHRGGRRGLPPAPPPARAGWPDRSADGRRSCTRMSPSKPARAARALRAASPVPSGRSWVAASTPSGRIARSGVAVGRHDHDGAGGLELGDRSQHPFEHRPAARRVQQLRRVRLHPGAPAGGQDDACERRGGHVGAGGGRCWSWGAWIRTRDHGTKTRCLTTWPRPTGGACRAERVYPARGPQGGYDHRVHRPDTPAGERRAAGRGRLPGERGRGGRGADDRARGRGHARLALAAARRRRRARRPGRRSWRCSGRR